MNKLPWMKFFPLDYIADTKTLSREEKGCWIDLICHLWVKDCGKLETDYSELSNLWGFGDSGEAENMIWVLAMKGICDVNEDKPNACITVTSRRMLRDKKDRENNRIRQSRFYRKHNITHEKQKPNAGEVRSQKLDVRNTSKDFITESKKFIAPNPEDVTAYAKEINFVLDGRKFVDFYAASGWRRGKTPIKDWKACVRTWKANSEQGATENGKPNLFERLNESFSPRDTKPSMD